MPQGAKVKVDRDGVRTIEDRRLRVLWWVFVTASASVVAATVVALAIFGPAPAVLEQRPDPAERATHRPESFAAPPAASPKPPATGLRAVHRTTVEAAARAAAQSRRAEGAQPSAEAEPELDAGEVIEALRAAGETEGIAAFPPPGTDPLKTGIVVPEGFELPAGYVRHYQTTDAGRMLEPILMFSSDYEFVDDAGRPVPLPPDGIVPPELAPRGLPIRMLELPKRNKLD